MSNVKAEVPAEKSVVRQYGFGYLLLLGAAALVFLISLFSSVYISSRYHNMTDRLLELNRMYASVESTNDLVYDYYNFLTASSAESYEKASEASADWAEKVLADSDGEEYSREAVDLCKMIETYLSRSDALMEDLSAYAHNAGSSADSTMFAARYEECQTTFGYIRVAFQELYSIRIAESDDERDSITSSSYILIGLQVAALIAAAVMTLLYYNRIVSGMSQVMKKLTHFAHHITRHPTDNDHIEINTGDEFEVFAGAFNEMIDTVQGQMTRIEQDAQVRAQLQQAEMENLRVSAALQTSRLNLLQSRINPHFLFNTLNMLVQTARMEGADETADMMEVTAQMMRYNMGSLTNAVTLGDEIENARNYAYIQQCRFGTRIKVAIHAEPGCLSLRVPCLIIQPLVENSISHGLKPLPEGGTVSVRAKSGDGCVILEVEDNGTGMSEERLAEVWENMKNETLRREHIGLGNVYQRLQLYFGDSLKFEIESAPGRTLIHIEMPAGGTPKDKAKGGEAE